MSEWISVSDAMPKVDVIVLTFIDGEHDFLRFNGLYWTRKVWPVGYLPTHWMPLPEPPKTKAP